VHGTDGMDELTTTGESVVARVEEREDHADEDGHVTPGESKLKAARITPEMAGLPRATLEDFAGGDIQSNVDILTDVLTGIMGPRRDIVLMNAAAALVAVGMAGDLKQGVELGAEAIDSGQAAATLAKLRQFGAKYGPQ
jgi:anthranilate phosphoribosyltransferase